MKKIEHELKVQGKLDVIHQALTSLHGLKSWHSAQIEQNDNEFTMIHKDHPSFSWKIISVQPEQRIEWLCTKGPGNSAGSSVFFTLNACDEDRVLIQCVHQDWAENDEHFNTCNTLWGMLLNHLKEFVETGTVKPTFN